MITVSHGLTSEIVTDFHENWRGHYAIRSHPNFTVPSLTITNNNKMAGGQTCEMAEKPMPLYLW